jgi:hypothetical protein
MNNELVSSHEEWKPIERVNGVYSVSDKGRVRNNRTGKILKPIKTTKGYVKVNLRVDGREINIQVHRLVAIAFIPNPENKPEVNHKNGIHDDNRLSNLEWVTQEENLRHAYDTGLVKHKDKRYAGYLHGLWKKRHKNNMCSEWQDYLTFYEWCHNNGYTDGKYIAAVDSSKPYSPDNCYVTDEINHPSKQYDCFGEKLDYKSMTSKYGLTEGCIKYRMQKGMALEDALMIPKGKAKDNILRVRLNRKLYNHVFEEANKAGVSASSYIRELIDKDISEKAKKFSEKN